MEDVNFQEVFSSDIRISELQSVKAIFPHTTKIDYMTLSGSIEIPVHLENGIRITRSQSSIFSDEIQLSIIEKVTHLPPLNFYFKLTDGYPLEQRPEIRITSDVISDERNATLYQEVVQIWDEYKDQVLFSMIDFLNQTIQYNIDSIIENEIACKSDVIKFQNLIEYNNFKSQEEFDLQTFTCTICQDEKKGKICSKFDLCDHIFCNNCLYDYFSSSIRTGEISKVHCPNFECNKNFTEIKEKYLKLQNIDFQTVNYGELKDELLKPPISVDLLVQILKFKHSDLKAVEDMVKRYQTLFVKQQYEMMSNMFPSRVVTCPRVGCFQQIFRENTNDQLSICPKCRYAFCNSCFKSWHSKFNKCKNKGQVYSGIPVEAMELWLESTDGSPDRLKLGYEYGRLLMKKMSDEYLMDKLFKEMLNDEKQGLKKCPTCEIVIQRLDGCNKMVCSACKTFFCNICGIYIPPSDPYSHFREIGSTCYGKLFDGMPGVE